MELTVDGLRAGLVNSGNESGFGSTNQISPERQRFGNVDTTTDAATADNGSGGQSLPYLADRLAGGDAPVSENAGSLRFARIVMTESLDL
jgi:hypothetical protein